MTICLSTNGMSVYELAGAPVKLLVSTTHGVRVLERDGAAAPWRITGHVLDGKHVSAMMIVPGGGIFAAVHHGGLFHSADDGATWEQRTNGLTIEHVYSLGYRVRPEGTVLYAGTEPVSLFRSFDNGLHWEELPAIGEVPGHEKWTFPPPPHFAHTKNFMFDPRDPDIFYATVEQGALLKTADGGVTWRELGSFYRPDDAWYKDVHRVAAHPSNPDELYMATGIGLYRSDDAGESWARLTDPGFRIGYPDQILFPPGHDDLMLMSGSESDPTVWHTSHHAHGTVMRSRDRGASWEDASSGIVGDGRANIEAFNMAVYPGGVSLFAGNTDGEVYASDDRAGTWSLIAQGLKPISKGRHFRNLQPVAG